jgi:hypothetical protein
MRRRQRLRDFIAVLLGFRRKNDMDSRLRQEIAFHIDMATEQKMQRGMAPDEARRTALVEFGGREQWRESARDEVRSRALEELLRDARYALRSLRRAPAFTAAAIATLALSIGATTSIFSVVNAVLLRRLPYPNADRIVALCEKNLTKPEQPVCGVGSLNPGNFLAWHDRVSALEASAAFVEQRVAITANGADPISPEPWPLFHRRRRQARWPECIGAEPCALATALRRRSRHRRTAAAHERKRVHGDRRDGGGLRPLRSGGCLDADPVHRGAAQRTRAIPACGRIAQTRRVVGGSRP